MAEWSIASVLKTDVLRGTGGSNPSLSAISPDYQAVAKSTPNFTPKNVRLGVFNFCLNSPHFSLCHFNNVYIFSYILIHWEKYTVHTPNNLLIVSKQTRIYGVYFT